VAGRPPQVSALLPAYDEEALLEEAVGRLAAILDEVGQSWEILVVDDGSRDATGLIADRLADADPRVRALHHPVNRCLGGALLTGFAAARGTWVLYLDVDVPLLAADLARALELGAGADLVCAQRRHRSRDGLRRSLYTWGYNRLVKALFASPLRDINFGFKLARRELLSRLELRSTWGFIDAELVLKARDAGARIATLEVDHVPRPDRGSRLDSPRHIAHLVIELARVGREIGRGPAARAGS